MFAYYICVNQKSLNPNRFAYQSSDEYDNFGVIINIALAKIVFAVHFLCLLISTSL